MTEIEEAIERHETQLYYQPIVSLATGQIMGFEALVRWLHPEYGLIFPAVFMPRPDQHDALIALTRWGLRQVGEDARLWQASERRRPFVVSLNLTNDFLKSKECLEEIAETTRGLAPQSFATEISEPQSAAEVAEFAEPLRFLVDAGIRLYIDNFGKTFSSVAALAELPICAVKVDRSLVDRLPADARSEKIVRALVAFSLSLDLEVIATGVETAEQARMMKSLDCDFVQGYYFSAPVGAESALRLLRKGVLEPDAGEEQQLVFRLRRFTIFADLSDEELAEIGRGCNERSVSRRTVLIRQGQVGNEVYLLEEGAIQVYREADQSLEKLAVMHAPGVFGEMAAVHPERIRTASVEAISDLHVLAIPVDVFLYFLRKWPPLKHRLLQLAAQRASH